MLPHWSRELVLLSAASLRCIPPPQECPTKVHSVPLWSWVPRLLLTSPLANFVQPNALPLVRLLAAVIPSVQGSGTIASPSPELHSYSPIPLGLSMASIRVKPSWWSCSRRSYRAPHQFPGIPPPHPFAGLVHFTVIKLCLYGHVLGFLTYGLSFRRSRDSPWRFMLHLGPCTLRCVPHSGHTPLCVVRKILCVPSRQTMSKMALVLTPTLSLHFGRDPTVILSVFQVRDILSVCSSWHGPIPRGWRPSEDPDYRSAQVFGFRRGVYLTPPT